MIKHYLVLLAAICFTQITAQVNITGHLNNMPPNYAKLINIKIQGTESQTHPDENGDFMLGGIKDGNYFVSFDMNGEVMGVKQVNVVGKDVNLGAIDLIYKQNATDEADDETPSTTEDRMSEESSQNVASVLNAGRDPFLSFASFNWSAFRYRIRGYDFGDNQLNFNTLPINDIETGNPRYSSWGGLNDVFRNRTNFNGISFTPYGFGGIAGFTNIDIRASKQWKQLRVGYAVGNRNYENRLMGTWSTGLLSNKWAFTISASGRYGNDGFAEGTYFRSLSYFAGAEKIIGRHSLSLSVFAAPTENAGSSPVVEELWNLGKGVRYNVNWGFQNDEKRNRSIRTANIPTAIFAHEWKDDNKTSVTTTLAFQKGKQGFTGIDWNNAEDPRPDYYRNLPYYYNYRASIESNPLTAQEFRDVADARLAQILADPNEIQVKWNDFYRVNYNAVETINNADGISGNNVTGRNARYWLGNNVNDMTIATISTVLDHVVSDKVQINGGFNYKMQKSHNYKVLEDLLGADFCADCNFNRFAPAQSGVDNSGIYFNLDDRGKLYKVGDKYQYDYNLNSNQGNVFVQSQIVSNKFDFFVGAQLKFTQIYREGNYLHGLFANNSLGKSETFNFINYTFKGGMTYKINGRNYLSLNGAYFTNAPEARNIYLSPQTRNNTASGDLVENGYSGEASYIFRSPFIKTRLTGYYTLINNQTRNRLFYNEDIGSMANYTTKGINVLHQGIEFGIEIKLGHGFTFSTAASVAQFVYNDNARSVLTEDNTSIEKSEEVNFIKGYRIGNTPQNVYGAGLNYRSPKFWYVTISANYMDNFWYDISPLRRTTAATDGVAYGSEQWKSIVDQTKQKAQFTLDFFGGGSKRFKVGNEKTLDGKIGKAKYHFIYFNVGVNNILNNQTIRTLGFEQLRYDYSNRNPGKFPMRYSFNQGLSYFISLSYKI